MSNFWILTTHKFRHHPSYEAAVAERDRLLAKAPAKQFTIIRRKGAVTSPGSTLEAAAPELLELARTFKATIEYYIRVDKADGDEEGARSKVFMLNTVNAAIAKATGAA